MADPHPREELAKLEGSLGAGAPAPGYVLRGAEQYFRARALDAIKRAAAEAGRELCVHDVKGPDFQAASMHEDLMGAGLFASTRCVVIHEPGDLLKKAGGKDSPTTVAVRSFLSGGRGTVVLAGKSLRADAGAVKAIRSAGGLLCAFRPLYDAPAPWDRDQDPRSTELVRWLGQRARELGVALDADRAVLLVHARGNDLGALDSALEEIRAGAGEAELRGGDGAAVSPFRVADEVLSGAPSGPGEVERLFRGGMRKDKDGTLERGAPALLAIVLGTLRNKVRQGLGARSALDAGLPEARALELAGVGGPPAVRKRFAALVAQRNARVWRRMLADVVALERRTRSRLPVDAADVMRLALRWQPKRRAGAGPRR